ncbi:MAG: methylenetetrahydrofolate reductase [Deltaproteobacteria bacterium]
MFDFPYLIEILTPKGATLGDLEERMSSFAQRCHRSFNSGCGVSIPDNPMGQPRYSLVEAVEFCGLPLHPQKTVMNLNSFHGKEELDGMLSRASNLGVKYLLVVRGDGGPALPKLEPESIGSKKSVVTSIDLLGYINREYADVFIPGAAFNQYNPMDFELDRLKQKIDAGARFIITQPVLGRDQSVDSLEDFNIPVVIEAWMSAKVDLLLKSVRSEKDVRTKGYDPVKNLQTLHRAYPENCVYLSMLSFKEDWKSILPRL